MSASVSNHKYDGGPIKRSLLKHFSGNDIAPLSLAERILWIPAHASVEFILGLSCLYAHSHPNHKYPSIHN